MAARTDDVFTDPARERLWTEATVITAVRTVAALVLALVGAWQHEIGWLVASLAVYVVGDSLDGNWARVRRCETRMGAVLDMLCDRLNSAGFYFGLVWLHHDLALPVAIYLVQFLVVDLFVSLSFLQWPIRSPNYFYVVDERIWRWNWSVPAKVVNSSLFGVVLLVTGWWWLGVLIAVPLLVLKMVTFRWVLQLGLPVPPREMVATPGASR